jgi:hypothetical protein
MSIVLLILAIMAMMASTANGLVVNSENQELRTTKSLRSLQDNSDSNTTENVVHVTEEDFVEDDEDDAEYEDDDEIEEESSENGRRLLNGPQIGADKSKPPGKNTWRTGHSYGTLKVVQGTYVIFSWPATKNYQVIMVNPGDDFKLCKSYNGGDITTGNKVEFDTKHYNGETLFFVGAEADCKKGQKLKLVIIPK